MSRSYKRTSFSGGKNKFSKTQANKKYRRQKMNDITAQHSQYKKHYDSWDIVDYFDIARDFDSFLKYEYTIYNSNQSYGWINALLNKGIKPTRKALYKVWYKEYKMK